MSQQSKKIINFKGEAKEIACLGCARSKGEINDGNIAVSKHFDAHQDYEIPIPGFIILSTKRHIMCVDELTDDEQIDFIKFLCRIRKSLREVLDIETVYLFQNEDTSHHFHVWIFPRFDWMDEKFGKKIQSVRPIMEYARKELKSKENVATIEEATQKLKQFLESKSI